MQPPSHAGPCSLRLAMAHVTQVPVAFKLAQAAAAGSYQQEHSRSGSLSDSTGHPVAVAPVLVA